MILTLMIITYNHLHYKHFYKRPYKLWNNYPDKHPCKLCNTEICKKSRNHHYKNPCKFLQYIPSVLHLQLCLTTELQPTQLRPK